MPGYSKLNLYPHNLTKARRLIARAKPTDRTITIGAPRGAPNFQAAVYYRNVLRRLGFNARVKATWFPSPQIDTGWSNWFGDYAHPNTFFKPLLSGLSLGTAEDSNFARIDVPALNRRIARLGRVHGVIPERRYAALAIDLSKAIHNPVFGYDLTSIRFR